MRPEVGLLVAETRPGGVVVFSAGGPCSDPSLSWCRAPATPWPSPRSCRRRRSRRGTPWTVGSDAARSISGYDALDDNALKATLETLDDARAVVRLKGSVRGSALGSAGTIEVAGTFGFDRKAGRVDALDVDRAEVRQPGPVEAGLDIKSTLSVSRSAIDVPADLADASLAGLPIEARPDRELLLFPVGDGKYSMIHDRDWHVVWDSARRSAFKRLAKGQVVANCTIAAGPNAGKGRHQDPVQLRDDIRKAAGPRFVKLIGEGTVDGPPSGGHRYKVSVLGKEGDVDVLWYYYAIAAPDGDQVLAVFTSASPARRRSAMKTSA